MSIFKRKMTVVKQHKKAIKQDTKFCNRMRCKYCAEAKIIRQGQAEQSGNNLKPEDVTKVVNAIQSAVLEAVSKLPDLPASYAARVAVNTAEQVSTQLIKRAFAVECSLHCVKLFQQVKQMRLELDLNEIR